ncbi:MAG: 4-(cytidine 5'-diphospho)-2-C-methyl-D-erythritol kinase [Deltaproteobacteria bacterium]|nr:4-(cytidine 5'-diphospho)-2-C-methyl-D-erythritol kinase [Deltaproteobacteria bacterium]
MNSIAFLSPAKVNLSLHVVAKRPDGYHELSMIMARVSLYDEVRLTLKDEGISLTCDDPSVPAGEENIAWQAASLLIEEKKLKTGIHIDIRKKIPMGGGLGGGSSNAASVLMGLNSLTGEKAETGELVKMGLSLGADVPFFIFQKPALAEGVGEKLVAVEGFPTLWLILINPGIHVPTGEIFSQLNLVLTKEGKNLNITRFNHNLSTVRSNMINDLENVTFEIYPEVREAKRLLLRYGAMAALMSGSGSTVFGLYKNRSKAESSLAAMGGDVVARGWSSFLVNSL